METKTALRDRLRAQRAGRSAAEREEAGTRLAAHALAAWSECRLVAAFASVRDEPPTQPLLDALVAAGVTVVLPVVSGAALDWATYDGWDALAAGPYGLLEPAGLRLGPSALVDADLLLVPALAVDRRGHRLGRGAGYYDRTLASGDGATVTAVVFDDELLGAVPVEPHDVLVDAALMPSALVRLDAQ